MLPGGLLEIRNRPRSALGGEPRRALAVAEEGMWRLRRAAGTLHR